MNKWLFGFLLILALVGCQNQWPTANANAASKAPSQKDPPPRPTQLKEVGLPELDSDPHIHLYGARIPRTMTLLATSNKDRRNKVKILFYGQSIVWQKWVQHIVETDLRARFPYADLTIENRAIGGYQAPELIRPAIHDVHHTYPDLVVFHDYGGERYNEFERIIAGIRRNTTAEILMWTHHLDNFSETRTAQKDRASLYRQRIAQKYNAELVDLRTIWRDYCQKHGFDAADLLRDKVHLNAKGGVLQGHIVKRHFVYNTKFPSPWMQMVRTYDVLEALDEPKEDHPLTTTFLGSPWKAEKGGFLGQDADGHLVFHFKGNRVDVECFGVKDKSTLGTAMVRLNGKPVSKHKDCYGVTRPSRMPTIWFPGINRVTVKALPVSEDYTLTVTHVANKGMDYTYTLKGSVSGSQGQGDHTGVFTSTSGAIQLNPRDFSFKKTHRVRKASQPTPFDITFSVFLMGQDTLAPQGLTEDGVVERYTLAQGMKNDWHTLTLTPNGDGVVPIARFVVYEPPLK